MSPLDLVIIVAYLILMAAVGWWSAKRASKSAETYFLAGKSFPWWIIGVAHGSSGVDITGTMWFVMMFFIYGMKATWLLWIWPLFNVIFRMMYLGTWVRRSNVLTGAEWMRTRFGFSRGAEWAYVSVVIYALVSVVGFLSYAFRGIAEFTKPFFPWDIPTEAYGTIMLLVTGVYCVVGGMYSVVMNDLIQFVLKVVAAIGIAAIAIIYISPADLAAATPAGWDNIFPSVHLNLDWSHLMPALTDRIYDSKGDGYSLFMFFVGILLFRGILTSMAGPTPNYSIQHILSTRSPREAALENMVMAFVSLTPRFLLIAAIAVLSLVFFSHDLAHLANQGKDAKFEEILPNMLNSVYIPIGFKGILVAALLASFMSTFVSTVNSGAAYVVNDIYKRYINPHASPKRSVALGWITSSGVILLGVVFGFTTSNVHAVTTWITAALVPAFVAPNVLKWHWWRFNGWGFCAGMVGGTAGALVIPSSVGPVALSLLVLAISVVASVGVCLATKPESEAILMHFYRQVRPWGFWGPIYERCRAEDPTFQRNHDFWRDWFNIVIGLVWQVTLVAAPIYFVIQHWRELWISLGVCAVTSLILKFTWYDYLGPGEMYLTGPDVGPAHIPLPSGEGRGEGGPTRDHPAASIVK